LIDFTPHPDIAPCKRLFDPSVHKTWYANDYSRIKTLIIAHPEETREAYAKGMMRELIKNDLFFILLFVMEIPSDFANKPYVVDSCRELEESTPDKGLSLTDELDIESREHFKSSIRTVALTIKRIVNDPECCTAIFSYKKDAADDFLRAVKETLEKPLMINVFPDVCYANPTESPSWSVQNGIRVRRSSSSRRENTVEAFGLVEGMPTGGHFDHRIYDDIETFDIAKSPTQMDLCFRAFEMSFSLGRQGGTELVQGTYYHHKGPLARIRDKKKADGTPVYRLKLKPCTEDGTRAGKPVLFNQEYLQSCIEKAGKHFDSQYLCNPTPIGNILLDSSLLKPIDPEFLSKSRFKFIVIDQAGDKDLNKTQGDLWSIGVVSITLADLSDSVDDNELGLSDVCLEDLVADQMTHSEAIETIVRMYMRSGMVMQLGVEKVGLSTTEIHITEALKRKGRILSTNHGNLVLLQPRGRSTEERVKSALQWPLNNGFLYYSTAIAPKYRDKLVSEMDNFPMFHADILNMWAYAYDMFKEFKFSRYLKPQVQSVTKMMQNKIIRGDF